MEVVAVAAAVAIAFDAVETSVVEELGLGASFVDSEIP